MTNPRVTVFLVSLKAGGVALNLTEASRCFIMDPWWNPSVENQAVDRIHRLGQKRPIEVTRFVIENSIESRIVQLQEKKMLLFQSMHLILFSFAFLKNLLPHFKALLAKIPPHWNVWLWKICSSFLIKIISLLECSLSSITLSFCSQTFTRRVAF